MTCADVAESSQWVGIGSVRRHADEAKAGAVGILRERRPAGGDAGRARAGAGRFEQGSEANRLVLELVGGGVAQGQAGHGGGDGDEGDDDRSARSA